MKKIAINARPLLPEHKEPISLLVKSLRENGAKLQVTPVFCNWLEANQLFTDDIRVFTSIQELDIDTDLVISIGGDGTILETVTFVGEKQIPILGINAGRLGFLANVQLQEINNAIEKIFADQLCIENRSLIQLESNIDLFNGLNFGVNEFSILKKDTSSMIVIHAYINGEYLNSYWSDGLIISTPTGSTGYSLSCGGPIVLPFSNTFVVAPLSPHNLNVRPLVIPDTCELTFKVEDRKKKFLVALDSRSKAVDPDIELKVKRAAFDLRLVSLDGHDFISTLRKKLLWGLDYRN